MPSTVTSTAAIPSTIRLQYIAQWLAAEQRWQEKHPGSDALANPIHDWDDATCAMMLPNYIDEWMDRFPPVGTDIAPKKIKTSKQKAVFRALRSFIGKISCM